VNKLSIRSKIGLLIVFSFISLLLIGAAGWFSVQSSERSASFVYKNNVVPMSLLRSVNENLKEIRYRMAAVSLDQLPFVASNVHLREARVAIERDWIKFQSLVRKDSLADDQKKEMEKVEKTLSEKLPPFLDRLAGAYRDENIKKVMSLLEDEWPKIHGGTIKPMNNLLPLFESAVANSFEQSEIDTKQTKYILLSLFLSLLVLLIIVGFWISAQIVRSLSSMQTALHDIELTADFSKRVVVTSNDEIGKTARVLNDLLAAQQAVINEANHVMSAIARADFSVRMQGDYAGDLKTLKVGVNGSAQSVAFMMGELSKVMTGLQEGRFDVQMDGQVPPAFRHQVEQALSTIGSVLSDINEVMHQMNDGEFSARVNSPAMGALLIMKNNINSSMTSLEVAISDVVRVLVAQSGGDLTQSISARYQGQLGLLGQSINTTADKIKVIVTDAVASSRVVNAAADQVSQGSADLSSRVQEQAAALERTSSTMHQMTSAVQSNTRNAQQAAQQADDVREKASQGVAVMQQTIDAMSAIRESSHKISDIVSLIDGIAFQTNLLALNAAVEAARAGEHGRGFAVVASEVRALAGKSAEAAKDIKLLINDSVQRIELGTDLADQSGEMLQEISRAISQVTESVGQIAIASSEQAQGIIDIHRSIHEIDRVTQENAALVEETAAAAGSLDEQAGVLRSNMAFFNTESNTAYRPAALPPPQKN
jgi:methyl-accepting chemotaxis protein